MTAAKPASSSSASVFWSCATASSALVVTDADQEFRQEHVSLCEEMLRSNLFRMLLMPRWKGGDLSTDADSMSEAETYEPNPSDAADWPRAARQRQGCSVFSVETWRYEAAAGFPGEAAKRSGSVCAT